MYTPKFIEKCLIQASNHLGVSSCREKLSYYKKQPNQFKLFVLNKSFLCFKLIFK